MKYSAEILKAYAHWVGLMPKGYRGEYCDKFNLLYKEGILTDLYRITQEHFAKEGIKEVDGYRALTGVESERVFVPFAFSLYDGKEYVKLKKFQGKTCNLINIKIPVESIYFNTMLFEDYFEGYIDDMLGMVPGLEYICLNNIDLSKGVSVTCLNL